MAKQYDFSSEELIDTDSLSIREIAIVVQLMVDNRGLQIVRTTNIDHGEEPVLLISLRPKS